VSQGGTRYPSGMFRVIYPLSILALGCQPRPVSDPVPSQPVATGPDVLLITVDTLRADRVGCYGDGLAATPRIDALASEGALFREAIATAPLTLPSHASLLTGLYPAGHGLRDNGGFRLGAEVPTLAESLGRSGYRSAAFVSAYVLDAAWGLDRGFDRYHAPFHPQDVAEAHAFGELEIAGADTVNAALAWLREPGDAPSFAWVHLYEPHTPWDEHPGWEGDPYRGEVAFADKLVGRLIDAVSDDALVIVTSDHGESLWEHGEREHGLLVNRASTRVPLVIRPPGGLQGLDEPAGRPGSAAAVQRPAGVDEDLDLAPVPDAPRGARVVEQPVSGVDLAATIADYAGAETVGVGISLRPALEGRPLQRGPVYSETFFSRFHYGWSELALVQQDRTRLRIGPQAALIDLDQDPAELNPAPVEEHALLDAGLGWLGEVVPQPGPITADELERLAALGYVEPVSVGATPRAELADPRERMAVLGRLHALELEPDPAVATRGLQALVDEEPGLVDARMALALALAQAGRVREALEASLAILELQPRHTMALSNAAALCRQLGEHEQGVELARRMQAINPMDPRGFRLEVTFWVDAERPAEVVRAADAGLAVEPDDPQLHYLKGLALIFLDQHAPALEALEAADRAGSRAGDIQLYRGTALDRLGRVDEALEAFRAYTRTHPDDLRGVAAAAWMLYKADDCARAEPLLVNLVERGHRSDPRIKEAYLACVEQPGG
jgi:arylsulfatase A-like enzyme/tetratricopeptide (TPR) repeat protein